MNRFRFTRRRFVGACASVGLVAGTSSARTTPSNPLEFPEVALVDRDGNPVSARSLRRSTEYLFFYPYRSTPCFLLRLEGPAEPLELTNEAGQPYRWPGGAGAERSIVAFVAICAHKLSYPTPSVSFIGYRREPIRYRNEHQRWIERDALIQCCSEHSLYDPKRGADVLAGPAPEPLTAIELITNDNDELIARGAIGTRIFERFFDAFGFRLDFEHEGQAQTLIAERSEVFEGQSYSRQRIHC